MRHTFLRKHFKLLYGHWITEAVKALASNRASERVRDALRQLPGGQIHAKDTHESFIGKDALSTNPLLKARALLSRVHVVDYDISAWLTPQIQAIKHKNQACREGSASERWRARVCARCTFVDTDHAAVIVNRTAFLCES